MTKLYTKEQKIGAVIMALFAILGVIYVCLLVLTAHPDIKYRILVSGTSTCIVAFILLLGIVYLCYTAPASRFHSFCSKSKLVYSILYLFSTVGFLWSIEYLLYIKDKEKFSIEQEYLDKSIQDRTKNINAELEIYQHFENTYKQLTHNVSPTKNYDCLKVNNKIYTIVCSDTLIIHLHRISSMTPKMFPPHKKDEINYYGAHSIGISTLDEPYNLLHPSSRTAFNNMKHKGYIEGVDLVELIHKKVRFYNQRCARYEEILLDNHTISFSAFLKYNLFNYSSIAKGTNIAVRILILLQTILITFISGYIYKTLYRILDGE